MKHRLWFVLAATFGAGIVAACSAASAPPDDGDGSAAGTSASGGHNLFAGTSASGDDKAGDDKSGDDGDDTGAGGGILVGSGGATGCAEDKHTGVLVPLDLVIMLDRSSSMDDMSKWDNVTSALKSFVQLPDVNGISVSMSYFPVPPTVPPPSKCATDADCGNYGPCLNFPGLQGCQGAIGGSLGVPPDSCDFNDYVKPDVALGELPGNAGAIVQSIDDHSPDGGTPTAEALGGALTYANQAHMTNPDHIVAVVLATDGEPMACEQDNDLDGILSVAEQGVQYGIKTFVIGIGTSSDDNATLNSIAMAGGTDKSFDVGTGSTAQDFANALNAIRGSVKCQYSLPPPPPGKMLDPKLVNVSVAPPGGGDPVTIPQVATPADCGGDPGWYYDDPSNPSQILLCGQSCDTILGNGMSGTIDILVGCATVIR